MEHISFISNFTKDPSCEGLIKSVLNLASHYKKEEFKYFDFGGVDLNAKYRRGNDFFKEGWGGQLVEKTQDISIIEYIWWKYLRHSSFFRRLKYSIQKFLIKIFKSQNEDT